MNAMKATTKAVMNATMSAALLDLSVIAKIKRPARKDAQGAAFTITSTIVVKMISKKRRPH